MQGNNNHESNWISSEQNERPRVSELKKKLSSVLMPPELKNDRSLSSIRLL